MLLCAIISIIALARHHGSSPTSTARSVMPPAMPSTPPIPPSETPSAEAPPPSVASASAKETPVALPRKPGRFDRREALSAIKDAVADLSSCSHKGVWGKGQVGVSFNNDGSVRKVYLSAPFTGDAGACVREHVMTARISPFVGIIGPTYAYFVIPF